LTYWFTREISYLCGVTKKSKAMTVEQTDEEVIIRLPKFMPFEAVQRTIDLLSLKEATARSAATQPDVDRLAREAGKGWWEKNRSRYIE